jgi:hypothetical protein
MTMEFTNNLPQGSPLNKMRYLEEKKEQSWKCQGAC